MEVGSRTSGGNLWRTTGDINDTWERMSEIGFGQIGLARYAGPGHWNDPDMLEVGNGGMTEDEYRTHMSLWAILAAPLLAGNDLSKMSPETLAILTNKEVIAVDQDRLGKQGDRASALGQTEIWTKPLSNGALGRGSFQPGRCGALGHAQPPRYRLPGAGEAPRSVETRRRQRNQGQLHRDCARARCGHAEGQPLIGGSSSSPRWRSRK